MPTLQGSDVPEVFAAQILLWLLLPFVLFSTPRWAVLAWLVMGNLDTTGPSSSVSSAVGWMNASKGSLLPLFILWRLRRTPSDILASLPAKLWLFLIAYVGFATVWSPFPLAAAKLIGNMIGTLLTFIVLEKAARVGLVDSRTIVILIAASLGLGILQTFYFGGVSYGFDGNGRSSRFSSFVSAQQYAAYLVAFLAIALWHPRFRLLARVCLIAAVGISLALNGSRTWFLGAACVVLLYVWFSSRRALVTALLAMSTVVLGSMLYINLDPNRSDSLDTGPGRIAATIQALATGQDTAQRAGLANWDFRLAIYDGILDDLRSSSLRQLVFGHGTSSGGNILIRVFPHSYSPSTVDPNRAIHNEWLRALYEWGIGGFCVMAAVLIALVWGLLTRYSNTVTRASSAAALSFVPAFLVAFTTENLIAGAGNAITMGLALVVATSWTPRLQERVRTLTGATCELRS